jgi:hypothetical protein
VCLGVGAVLCADRQEQCMKCLRRKKLYVPHSCGVANISQATNTALKA